MTTPFKALFVLQGAQERSHTSTNFNVHLEASV